MQEMDKHNLPKVKTVKVAGDCVNCPTCTDALIHFQTPIQHPDHDDYDSPAGTRGEWLEIPAGCECGARLTLILSNHKGDAKIHWLVWPDKTADRFWPTVPKTMWEDKGIPCIE